MRINHSAARGWPVHGDDLAAHRSGLATETFTPIEELILDTLAARNRLGEVLWTFDSRVTPILVRLKNRGLVDVVFGDIDHSVRAGLTPAGRSIAMDGTYSPPSTNPTIECVAEADELALETIVKDEAGLAWQRLVTVEGPMWFSTIYGPQRGFGPLTSGELLERSGRIVVLSVPCPEE